jgi:hypothetical protein
LALFFGCQNVQKPSPLPVTGDAARWIAEKAVQRSSEYPFQKIAVVAFTDHNGNKLSYGKFMADRIRNYLVQSPSVRVVEHISERNDEKWTAVDPSQAGFTLKTEVVLEGKITQMPGYNDIRARLYDGHDGKQIEEYRVRESIEDFKLNEKLDKEKLLQPISGTNREID